MANNNFIINKSKIYIFNFYYKNSNINEIITNNNEILRQK